MSLHQSLFLALILIVCVVVCAMLINVYSERKEAKKEKTDDFKEVVDEHEAGHQAAHALFMASKNKEGQDRLGVFIKRIDSILDQIGASKNRNNLSNIITAAINWTEREINVYRKHSGKDSTFIPHHDLVVLDLLLSRVLLRAPVKDWGDAVVAMIKFIEVQFQLHGMMSVAYRHKNQVNFESRTQGLLMHTREFIQYFVIKHGGFPGKAYPLVDILHLEDNCKVSASELRKQYCNTAINNGFMPAMNKLARLQETGAADRKRNEEHRHNRKKRASRIKKQAAAKAKA